MAILFKLLHSDIFISFFKHALFNRGWVFRKIKVYFVGVHVKYKSLLPCIIYKIDKRYNYVHVGRTRVMQLQSIVHRSPFLFNVYRHCFLSCVL